jgi:hypothetical protein
MDTQRKDNMKKDNRPQIRVTPEAHELIKTLALKGNRSMTKQVDEILVIVSQPEQNFNQSKLGVMAKHADGRIEVNAAFLDPCNEIENRQARDE